MFNVLHIIINNIYICLYAFQGNRIQASIKADSMNRFKAILDEGSCYRISNFGVDENGGKFPLLSHKFKISFFKNTAVTRVNNFDNNLRGFCFEPFTNFNLKTFAERDLVGKSLFHFFYCFLSSVKVLYCY